MPPPQSPEHKEGPRSVATECSHPGTGMFFWKNMPFGMCSLKPASSQRWDSHFRNRPLKISSLTHIPASPRWCSVSHGDCHKCKLKWRGLAASTAASSFPSLLFEPDWLFCCWHRWEGNVKYIWAFESCLKFLSSVKFSCYMVATLWTAF